MVGTMQGRAVAGWGIGFTVLLLVSAGMATVPGVDDALGAVRQFYAENSTVVVVSQLVGLAAAVVFAPFAVGSQRQLGRNEPHSRSWLSSSGLSVSAAAALAAIPPLLLCFTADSGRADLVLGLAEASDLIDVVLFTVIAAFAAAVFACTSAAALRVLAAVVAVICVSRAILLLIGSDALELVAPVAFLVLVVSVSVVALRTSLLPEAQQLRR
jgi:hypothetical protein